MERLYLRRKHLRAHFLARTDWLRAEMKELFRASIHRTCELIEEQLEQAKRHGEVEIKVSCTTSQILCLNC
jgi:hypothetical protein